ncbi:uncharacterized protein LOC141864010 [Acropora palmata]
MFDFRQASDALWHQFQVKLSGVLDLQLLEVIYRREHPTESTSNISTKAKPGRKHGNRRIQKTDEVEKVYGFGRCLQLYLQDEKLVKIKGTGKELLEEKYTDLYRCKTERSFDHYETNAYLPLGIIPEKGTLSFPAASTACTRRDGGFPQEEFSVTQLRKGEQKCRVCKEIKRLEDVQINREDNWERNTCEEDDYIYIPEAMCDHAFQYGYEPWERPCSYFW